jgi:hypothetical protein
MAPTSAADAGARPRRDIAEAPCLSWLGLTFASLSMAVPAGGVFTVQDLEPWQLDAV